jgi:Ca-activated chloride channel family protein
MHANLGRRLAGVALAAVVAAGCGWSGAANEKGPPADGGAGSTAPAEGLATVTQSGRAGAAQKPAVAGAVLRSAEAARGYGAAPAADGTAPSQQARGAHPPSTGGTDVPNDQAYDAMFFQHYGANPFVDTEDDRQSTFGLDVDTASYTIARRYLREGHLPPPAAVRVEEFVNFFDYGYPNPESGDVSVVADGARLQRGKRRYLVRFGLRARDVTAEKRLPANLTFVIDVSGSMHRENRLGAVKRGLGLMLDQLRPDDRVGLVIYGSRGEVVLEHTGDKEKIRQAIDRLAPGGSTNAAEGLELAYGLARRHLRERGINRLILCSDGVANMGNTAAASILEQITDEARDGIELTTIGFGMGNYNDVLMEQLADRGNGSYAYVDSDEQTKRVFVENLTGMLQTVARDAKVQVEWNPEVVQSYRLIGYENRDVADRDFRNDKVDAGEVGAGHQVTALYEVKLVREPEEGPLATIRLRYKTAADEREVVELERDIRRGALHESFHQAPVSLQLAAVAAGLGEVLRQSYWARDIRLDQLTALAEGLPGLFDGDEDVRELAELVAEAARLRAQLAPTTGADAAGASGGAGGLR